MSDDLVKSMEDDLRIGCSASIGDTQKAVATLKAQAARIAELEAALQDIASGRYSNVILPTHPPQDPGVVRARAALEGKKE